MAFLSGFCNPSNPSNPADSHQRCHGSNGDDPCVCACHIRTGFLDATLALRADADDLNEADLDGLSWETAVETLHHLRLTRQTLSAIEDALTRHIAGEWRKHKIRDRQEVEGIGSIEVRRSKDRKAWEHDRLGSAVIDANLAATEGELPDPFTISRWVLDAAAPSYWRTGVLKKLGLDPDEYCESIPGRTSVQITSNDHIGATE